MAAIDVQKVMKEIRAEVRRRKAQHEANKSVRRGSEAEPFTADPQISHLDLELDQDVPSFEGREQCLHIQDFLKYRDRDFIINAYVGILKRLPNPEGLNNWLHHLRKCRMTKTDILYQMRYSAEGRAKGVKVTGLHQAHLRKKLSSVPLAGYIFRLVTGFVRLPKILTSLQALEASNDAFFFDVRDDFRKVQMKLNEVVDQVLIARDLLEKRKADLQKLEDMISQEGDRIGKAFENIADQRTESEKQLIELKEDIEQIQTKISVIMHAIGSHELDIPDQDRWLQPPWKETIERLPEPVSKKQIPDQMYVSFEEVFRGDRQDIKQKSEVYLPYIEDVKSRIEDFLLLDLGCGRGEWLELLRERDIPGRGVDHNHSMIKQCKEYGLDVFEGDAIESLRDFPTASIGAVTAFHLIEHLAFDVLVKVIDETVRVLKPGGIAIFETPNPENILVGAYSFHLDPTHHSPLPAPTVELLVKARGLRRVEIKYLHPYGEEFKFKDRESELVRRFEDLFYGAQDYAIIAYK